MKRQNEQGGMSHTKAPHSEKSMGKTSVSDLKYTHGDNAENLKKSVDSLSSYVKSHKMKY